MKRLLHENSLSICLGFCFAGMLAGQFYAGYLEYNTTLEEHGEPTLMVTDYFTSAHFLEATTENWESEFLQMFMFVILTAFLHQKGSAESRPFKKDPPSGKTQAGSPWPVRKGGWLLTLYENSLSLAFLFLFLLSFVLHAVSGADMHNENERTHGKSERTTTIQYMFTSRFWFESFQNWQSEFLAVGSMVVLSIFLRQKGSPESKKVTDPHSKTGTE